MIFWLILKLTVSQLLLRILAPIAKVWMETKDERLRTKTCTCCFIHPTVLFFFFLKFILVLKLRKSEMSIQINFNIFSIFTNEKYSWMILAQVTFPYCLNPFIIWLFHYSFDVFFQWLELFAMSIYSWRRIKNACRMVLQPIIILSRWP